MTRKAVFNRFRLVALTATLLLTIGLVTACGEPSGGSTSQSAPTPTALNTVQPTATLDGQDVLYVIYFHRTQRCSGCIYAEDGITWTIDTYFADEVDDGELIFMSIDLQDQANKALVEKYGAYTSQLFMNKVTNGVEEIEQITSVWFYLGNNQAFADAFKAEIDKRLE
ncbi:MAG: nitrophenyl compound nitroreductase subunit ArsF family protein [Dehalococcoidia bacterium]